MNFDGLKNLIYTFGILFIFLLGVLGCQKKNNDPSDFQSINAQKLEDYVAHFNQTQEENVVNYISDDESPGWMKKNIPLFSAPDSAIEKIYYYRWWTFRKHLKETPEGFIFDEFITPVGHAGRYNTISCALGHHIYEGRWLHNKTYLDQYIWYWLLHDQYEPQPVFHKYSSWIDNAVYHRYLVNQDSAFVIPLITDLDRDYKKWEEEKQLSNDMFWQYDVRDGMEESISGGRHVKNIRPTINSYMYGNAKALAKIADIAQIDSLKRKYEGKAAHLKELVQENLWSKKDHFFEVLEEKTGKLSGTREEIGYIPWYFGLPDDNAKSAKAWDQIEEHQGFKAPKGLTTAERRDPEFRTHGTGGSEWDGAVWPFATTQTLKGLARLLTQYEHHGSMGKTNFYNALETYAMSHEKRDISYIGEYFDGTTGEWLHGDNPRSRFYNHSGFADLVINDLVGLKPQPDDTLKIKPLIPEGKWDWFCLNRVKYHGRMLTILWDKTGERYDSGQGFNVYADGERIFHADSLSSAECVLPQKSANPKN